MARHRTKLQPEYSSESESSNEWTDMLDDEENKYIMSRLAKQPQLLSNIPEKEQENKRGSKRKIEENVEEKYEKELSKRPNIRTLLPIKTKYGIEERKEECEESETEDNIKQDEKEPDKVNSEVSAEKQTLEEDKLRIGALCSSLLENPEKKIKNLLPILYLMEEKLKDDTPNLISVRKLATISAAEVFRDILPDYKIRHQDHSDVKLKKDTLALYKYEKELVEFYKRYLQKLEKAANIFRCKKGDNRQADGTAVGLALVSVRCMCDVLVARPNFNYATNIAQSLVPLLAARDPRVRSLVTGCFVSVFAEDAKGEITLVIVRLINQLVKRRGDLHPSGLDCLLSMKIFEDIELQQKKRQEKHKGNFSKKEKKRAKKLKEVERELAETRAAVSEAARKKLQTDITKTVLQIYFRLLKTVPRGGLLSAVLAGLAKFTHVINIEYYSELVSLLARLLRDEQLGECEQLQVVHAGLAMLAGAGDALAVDPATFHRHLYHHLPAVHAGSTADCAPILIEALVELSSRARRMPSDVLRAFAKRLCGAALQLPHHAAHAALALLHRLVQQNKSLATLFEPEEAVGSARYDPLLPSPEHCGAAAATAFEACALRRHYHPALRSVAGALLAGRPHHAASLTSMQIRRLDPPHWTEEVSSWRDDRLGLAELPSTTRRKNRTAPYRLHRPRQTVH